MKSSFFTALFGVAWLGVTAALGADFKLPDLPRGMGESCVEPTVLMRKNHMDYLLHQRDLTVHDGIRTRRHSLVGCVQCHAQPSVQADGTASQMEFIAVDAPGQFCQSCHQFTGVKLDCFECHANTPDGMADGMTGRGAAQ